MSPPSSETRKKSYWSFCLFNAISSHGLFFNPEDGSKSFLRTVFRFSTDQTALYSRRQNSSHPVQLEQEILQIRLVYWKACQIKSESGSELHCHWQSVSQYVPLGVEPTLGLNGQILFSFRSVMSEVFCFVSFWAPSLTRGRVCHLSV
jgi:hypothetical protein